MSPVFGAVILWLATVILWWSGWKEEAAGGIPRRAVAVFLVSWPLFVGWGLPLTSSLSLNGAWIWTIALVIAIAWKMEASWRWTSVSAGLLFGSVYLLLHRVANYPFHWSKIAAPWGAAILIGVLAALLLRDAPLQLLSLSVAIAISEAVTAIVASRLEAFVPEPSLEWTRDWWVAILCARLCSWILAGFTKLKRREELNIDWRRGGERP
ncbi:hypothetical protein [Cohnella panacarvi]|uniref:hypothetical protein n=1 Tax=Cohnella panacarvi TaxID=400776 RepID=UPI00047CD00B|nr:hypothetical protein [Cohnella panacarvi]